MSWSKAPVNMVPVELLSEVFVLCLPGDLYGSPDPLLAPLIFLRLCRYWGDTALSIKQLWCALSVTAPENTVSASRRHHVKQWLARSGTGPLHLKIQADDRSLLKVDSYMPLLAPHFQRCTELHLHLPFEHIREFPNLPMPALESACLVLDMQYHSGPNHEDHLIISFDSSPRLRSVDLATRGYFLSYNAWPLYARLTRLQLHNIFTVHHLRDALRRCERLEYCKLHFSDRAEYDADEPEKLILPSLRVLDVDVTSVVLDDLLLTFVFPALRTLHIKVDEDFSSDVLLRLLSGSKCPLEDLQVYGARHLFNTRTEFDAFATLLGPSLKRLWLGGVHHSRDAFNLCSGRNITALSFVPSENRFPLPLLEDLTVAFPSDVCPEEADVLPAEEMLLSRLQRGDDDDQDRCLKIALIAILAVNQVQLWSCENGSIKTQVCGPRELLLTMCGKPRTGSGVSRLEDDTDSFGPF
ncbi:hypothetical protein GLOTRDRAFT_95735 [Gloeophyllum trabeum ATCC 11539]|uniref:F-box domain-containing protein n=1 Tax=Gloeophyllum trabeum (strain ATCC 11539 / FP-39264 / Madison 617) TaxID=670483 RepID=S7RCY2_GLOTA|nr:uncharacterized protein GLOTRDRAFT_95735 [Gloeophyllum trabeum ATCC 11539]EPQ52055.1 hypothetical protein GLOTRDRAFT_95735 [Gloeophyllum trabeum ATCC 11539]